MAVGNKKAETGAQKEKKRNASTKRGGLGGGQSPNPVYSYSNAKEKPSICYRPRHYGRGTKHERHSRKKKK